MLVNLGFLKIEKRLIILGINKELYPDSQENLKDFYEKILPKYKVKN